LDQYRKRFINPLRTQAESTSNPRQIVYNLALADLVERQLIIGLENSIAIARHLRMGRIAPQVLERLTSDKLKLVALIIKLTEALCK